MIQRIPLTSLLKTGMMIDATDTWERQYAFNYVSIIIHQKTVHKVPQVAKDDWKDTMRHSGDPLQSLPHPLSRDNMRLLQVVPNTSRTYDFHLLFFHLFSTCECCRHVGGNVEFTPAE